MDWANFTSIPDSQFLALSKPLPASLRRLLHVPELVNILKLIGCISLYVSTVYFACLYKCVVICTVKLCTRSPSVSFSVIHCGIFLFILFCLFFFKAHRKHFLTSFLQLPPHKKMYFCWKWECRGVGIETLAHADLGHRLLDLSFYFQISVHFTGLPSF